MTIKTPIPQHSKIFKRSNTINNRIFPGDPTGLPDEFIFGFLAKYLNLKGELKLWKKH